MRTEAYGAFAWAYDQSLGKSFFATVAPLLDRVLAQHRNRGTSHLDVACGTGLAIEFFSRRGYSSIGIDASIPMLSVAAKRATRLICGDLRRVPLRCSFAVITSLYDSLNHLLTRRDLEAAFQSVRRVMTEESIFIFDMNQPEIYLSAWATPEPFEARGADYELRIDTSYSRWRRLGFGRVSGWARVNGRRVAIEEMRTQRAYSRPTIEQALSRADLRLVDVIDFDPFPSSSTAPNQKAKWLFVARAV